MPTPVLFMIVKASGSFYWVQRIKKVEEARRVHFMRLKENMNLRRGRGKSRSSFMNGSFSELICNMREEETCYAHMQISAITGEESISSGVTRTLARNSVKR